MQCPNQVPVHYISINFSGLLLLAPYLNVFIEVGIVLERLQEIQWLALICFVARMVLVQW